MKVMTGEGDRLEALAVLGIMDTPPEPVFDSLARLAAAAFKAPVALVSLVDDQRQWVKAGVGLDLRETSREGAFCDEVVRQRSTLVISDAAKDERFAGNPLVTGPPHVRFYAGAPLTSPQGAVLGSLCVIDFVARDDFDAAAQIQLSAMSQVVVQAMLMRRDPARRTTLVHGDGRKQALLAKAESVGQVGYFVWDLKTSEVAWSDDLYRIHGLSPTEPAPGREALRGLYAPEDMAKLADCFDRARRDASPFASRVQVTRPDGGVRYLSLRAGWELDAAGEPIALFGAMTDFTDIHLAEEQRRRRGEGPLALVQDAPDVAISSDARGKLTYLSPEIEGLLGYRPDELVGVKAASLIAPEDRETLTGRMAAFIAQGPGGKGIGAEYRGLRKDGSTVWLESRPRAIFDADGGLVEIQDVVRDISTRKALEFERAAIEQRRGVLADNVADIIIRTSMDLRIRYASSSMKSVTGFGIDDFGGVLGSFLARIHPNDQEAALAHKARIRKGKPTAAPSIAFRFQRMDGEWIWLECRPVLVRDALGQPFEVVDIIRDITAQRRLEDGLRHARDAAEAATAAKADFIANMSHEIRTPLTAILGFTKLLAARDDLDVDAKRHINRVGRAGAALLTIVNDILDFSKLEAGKMKMSPVAVSPRTLLDDALMMFSAQAAEKGLALKVAISPAVPSQLIVDPDRLQQVLFNLIGNAVKFTEKGSVLLRADYDAPQRQLNVAVEDTGIGLTEGQRHKLFRRFSQLDPSAAQSQEGTGLGLAICRELVEAMGGKIIAHGAPNKGAVFQFSIQAPAAEAPVLIGDAVGRAGDGAALALVRVLVIDEDEASRALVRRTLEKLGAEVSEAHTSADDFRAWEIASAAAGAPDVVVLGLGGVIEADQQRLRQLDEVLGPARAIPIVGLVADGCGDALIEPSRFEDMLCKPIDPAVLVRAVWCAAHGKSATMRDEGRAG